MRVDRYTTCIFVPHPQFHGIHTEKATILNTHDARHDVVGISVLQICTLMYLSTAISLVAVV